MRNPFLLLVFLVFSVALNAQNLQSDSDPSIPNYDEFNQWSLEAQFGFTKPFSPFDSKHYTSLFNFGQFDIGARYMMNEKFGLKLDFGYNKFSDGGNSDPFDSRIVRTSLQGVINAGEILGFRDWTQTVNVLFHAGAGYANLDAKDTSPSIDHMAYLTAGVTPQIRLSKRLVLTGDISIAGNIKQDVTFNGTHQKPEKRGVNGSYVDTSIGLTYYLGDKSKHVDWISKSKLKNDD